MTGHFSIFAIRGIRLLEAPSDESSSPGLRLGRNRGPLFQPLTTIVCPVAVIPEVVQGPLVTALKATVPAAVAV